MKKLNNKLRTLSSQEPMVIPIDPIGEMRECHKNVFRHVMIHGGKHVKGWAIVEETYSWDVYFHSVWQRPDGKMIDITPPAHDATSIRFLPSDDQTNQWPRGMDFRFPKSNNKYVKRAIVLDQRRRWKARMMEAQGYCVYEVYESMAI